MATANSEVKRGRPSTYKPEIAERICAALAAGDSVRTMCAADGMPEERTVFRWLATNEEFRQQYARGREARADARFEQVDQIMQDLRDGKIDANMARVMLDAIKWQTGKESPKRYGDKVQTEVTGADGGPVQSKVLIEFV